jgi:solute carrier family 25 folate transporter 32
MMRGVIQHEGIWGLYQGLTPAVIGSAVSWGGFFYVYESMKRRLRQFKSQQSGETITTLNSWDNFQVATLSGILMVFITNPVWLIKLRMQLQMKKTSEQLHMNKELTHYDGFFDAVRKIVKQEGFWALYKGTGPALLLTSHGGVQFVVYEFLRKHFHYAKGQRTTGEESSVIKRLENSLGYLSIGAISKMTASTVTYPFQVIKSRMQQQTSSIELTSTGDVRVVKRDYTKLTTTAHRIWKKEGVTGFFKGVVPNAVRVAPSAAVTFVVYETVMDMLSEN